MICLKQKDRREAVSPINQAAAMSALLFSNCLVGRQLWL
jgi:hypothetical protein